MSKRERLGASQSGWCTTAWIDPGGATGWAVMSVHPSVITDNKPIHRHLQHWSCGEFVGNENQMSSQALELFWLWDDAAVGIEGFRLRQMAVELSPVRVTSKIEYGLWLQEKWEAEEHERDMGRGRMVWKQDPSLAKRTLPDDRQREFGLWSPGKDHKRDATKHCFTFLQRAQERPTLRANAWPLIFKRDGSLLMRQAPTSKRSKY